LVLGACFPSAANAALERYIVVLKDSVSDSAEGQRRASAVRGGLRRARHRLYVGRF